MTSCTTSRSNDLIPSAALGAPGRREFDFLFMPDRLTQEQRSRNMRAVRSKATKPELLVRRWLWSHGYRYRLNVRSVPGSIFLGSPLATGTRSTSGVWGRAEGLVTC